MGRGQPRPPGFRLVCRLRWRGSTRRPSPTTPSSWPCSAQRAGGRGRSFAHPSIHYGLKRSSITPSSPIISPSPHYPPQSLVLFRSSRWPMHVDVGFRMWEVSRRGFSLVFLCLCEGCRNETVERGLDFAARTASPHLSPARAVAVSPVLFLFCWVSASEISLLHIQALAHCKVLLCSTCVLSEWHCEPCSLNFGVNCHCYILAPLQLVSKLRQLSFHFFLI